jgi:hypothetical protein
MKSPNTTFTSPSGVAENPPALSLAADPSRTITGELDGEAAGGYTLTDTADTIRPPTPEEDAAYKAKGKEIEADAIAILATSEKFLTGYETQVCERAAGFHNGMTGVDMGVFNSLRTEFSREIAKYKNQTKS